MWFIAEEKADHQCMEPFKRIVGDGIRAWATTDGVKWFQIPTSLKQPDETTDNERESIDLTDKDVNTIAALLAFFDAFAESGLVPLLDTSKLKDKLGIVELSDAELDKLDGDRGITV